MAAKAWLWCARVTWALLPISTGGAIADALSGWSTAPARVAAAMLWCAWTLGLVAMLLPRPWGLTVLRVFAPVGVVVSLATIAGAAGGAAVVAVSSSIVAAAFALSAPVAQAAANAMAYGEEERFPLRIPLSLFFGPLPIAVLVAGAGASVGPLLLAAGHVVAGIVVTVVGVPLAVAAVRSVNGLSRRWLVLVPAGVVIVDPLNLLDPVLMRREQIERLGRSRVHHSRPGGPPADALDLRLGTAAGSIAVELAEPLPFARRRGRHDADVREATTLLVSPVRADALVALAGARRIATT